MLLANWPKFKLDRKVIKNPKRVNTFNCSVPEHLRQYELTLLILLAHVAQPNTAWYFVSVQAILKVKTNAVEKRHCQMDRGLKWRYQHMRIDTHQSLLRQVPTKSGLF